MTRWPFRCPAYRCGSKRWDATLQGRRSSRLKPFVSTAASLTGTRGLASILALRRRRRLAGIKGRISRQAPADQGVMTFLAVPSGIHRGSRIPSRRRSALSLPSMLSLRSGHRRCVGRFSISRLIACERHDVRSGTDLASRRGPLLTRSPGGGPAPGPSSPSRTSAGRA